jgi:DnaJ family protein C protein 11
LFGKLKRAYDVLIDPHKRAIYDSVGVKGLVDEELQLVVRSKSPQEIREEYERLAKEKEQKYLENLTHSRVCLLV